MADMTKADDTALDAATDALYAGADEHLRPLHDAVVELTHDLTDDDDIAARPAPGAIHLVRAGRPFVALAPGRDATLRIGFRLGAHPSRPGRLTAPTDLPGCTHEAALPSDAVDDDVRDIEPFLAAAYDAATGPATDGAAGGAP